MLSGHVLGPELQSLVECTETGEGQDCEYSSQVMWTSPSTPSEEGEKLLLSFLNEIGSTDMTQLLRLGGGPQPSPRVDNTHKHSQPTKTKKGKQKLTWLRRKESLAALRQETAELTTQLAELERRRALEPEKWKAGLERNRLQKALADRIYLKARLRVLKRFAGSEEKILEQLLSNDQLQSLCHLRASRSLHKELRVSRKFQLNAAWVFDALEASMPFCSFTGNNTFFVIVSVERQATSASVLTPKLNTSHSAFHTSSSSSLEEMKLSRVNLIANCPSEGFSTSTASTSRSASIGKVVDRALTTAPHFEFRVFTGGNHLVMKALTIPGGFVALMESTVEWSVDMGHSKVWRHVTNNSCAISMQRVQQPNATDSGHRTKVAWSFDVNPGGSSCAGGGSSHVEADFLIPSIQGVMNSRLQTIQNMVLGLR